MYLGVFWSIRLLTITWSDGVKLDYACDTRLLCHLCHKCDIRHVCDSPGRRRFSVVELEMYCFIFATVKCLCYVIVKEDIGRVLAPRDS